jgi:hypothetical protein
LLLPGLKNQNDLLKRILSKNPECKITKKVAKQLEKDYGNTFNKNIG